MKTIEEAAREYGAAMGSDPTKPINATYDVFKQGVKFAQRWIPIDEELPEYYNPVIGIFIVDKFETEAPLCVWRAWSEEAGNNVYTITGTNIITCGSPLKWRPIEYE